jgi:hypothetical protein
MSTSPRGTLTVMFIGDRRVGKLSVPWQYARVYGNVPPSLKGGMWNQNTVECHIQFPLNSSPTQSKEQQDQERLGKTASRVTKEKSKPESKMVDMRVYFWRVPGFRLQAPISSGMSHMCRNVDAVVICYDCTRPNTLHNAIYKVCAPLPALTSGYGN